MASQTAFRLTWNERNIERGTTHGSLEVLQSVYSNIATCFPEYTFSLHENTTNKEVTAPWFDETKRNYCSRRLVRQQALAKLAQRAS